MQWKFRNCTGPEDPNPVPREERKAPAFPEGMLSFKRMVAGLDLKSKTLPHLTDKEDPIWLCPLLDLDDEHWLWVREFGFHVDGHAPPRHQWGRFYMDTITMLKSERGAAFEARVSVEAGG